MFASQGAFFYEACAREGLDPAEVLKYCKSPNGGLYGVPSLDLNYGNAYSNRAWICKDFLEALDMESPTTADELYEFLKAVKENDLNGNGKNDEIGIIGSANGWNGKSALLASEHVHLLRQHRRPLHGRRRRAGCILR